MGVVRPICPGISVSQSGFGGAVGGTLGCFVEDRDSGAIMLLSNMHVIQFYQANRGFFSTQRPKAQLDIVQPCTMELKQSVLDTFGHDKKAVWDKAHKRPNHTYGTFKEPDPPTEAEIKAYYTKTCNDRLAALVELCLVAEFARGFLEKNFDAAVATLKPGTMWTNATPDGTQILAPPASPTPAGRLWKYGDASGVKKWARGMVSQVEESVPFKTFDNDSMLFGDLSAAFKPLPVKFEAGATWKITGEAEGPYQIQGDSGSALCNQNNQLIGLMSAGGVGKTAQAIPIDVVFERLNVRFPVAPNGMA